MPALKTVIMLSGGLDFTVLAHAYDKAKFDVIAGMFINYGQDAAMKELYAARRTSLKLGIPLEICDVPGVTNVIWGLYKSDFHALMAEQTRGYSCGDRSFADAIAGTYAVLRGASRLLVGSHKDDLTHAPGTSEYFKHQSIAISKLNGNCEFEITAPLIGNTKAEIVDIGHKLGIDLAEPWACRTRGPIHCGSCPGCLNRKDAFGQARVADTMEYVT